MSIRWIVVLCATLIVLSGCASEPPKPISQCFGAECSGHSPSETGCDDISETWMDSVYTHGKFGDLRGQLILHRGKKGSENHRCQNVYWAEFIPFPDNKADFYVVTPLRAYDDPESVVKNLTGLTDPVTSNAMFAGERYPVNGCVEMTSGELPEGQTSRRMCMDETGYPRNMPVPPFDEDTF